MNQYPVLKNHVTISLAVSFSLICYLKDLVFWINYYVIGQKLVTSLVLTVTKNNSWYLYCQKNCLSLLIVRKIVRKIVTDDLSNCRFPKISLNCQKNRLPMISLIVRSPNTKNMRYYKLVLKWFKHFLWCSLM